MAPHSSTLAWKIPWMEEPGKLQSMGSLRVGHNWATSLSLFTFMHWRRKWQPTPVFLPGESQGWGAWWAAVSGVAQRQTPLKWLNSSSSSSMDYSPPVSSVHGIFQARILEWVAMPSSMGSSQPRDWTHVSYVCCIGGQILYQNNDCLFLDFCSNNSKPILLPTPPLLPPPFTSLHGGQ